MSRRSLLSVRRAIEAEVSGRLDPADVVDEISAALDVIELSEALDVIQSLLPGHQLADLAVAFDAKVEAAEGIVELHRSDPRVRERLWSRPFGAPDAAAGDPDPAAGDLLATASRALYVASDPARDHATWCRLIRERSRTVGPVLVDFADKFALTLTPQPRGITLSSEALVGVVKEFVALGDATDVLDLFAPVGWLESDAPAMSLPGAFGDGELVSRAAALALDDFSGSSVQAGTYEFGRFGEPRWFVRRHGTVRDLVAQVHEQGHAYAALVALEEQVAHANLVPTEAGECVAYGAELILGQVAERPEVSREVARMAAQNAFCALFGRCLDVELRKDEPGAVARAWTEAGLLVHLRTEASAHEWLLTSIEDVRGPLYEDHAVGHVAARGALLGPDPVLDLARAVVDAFGQGRLREKFQQWVDVAANSLGEGSKDGMDHVTTQAGIELPSEAELAQRIPHLDQAVAVFLSGSLVAGLGHANSDIDVYVVTEGSAPGCDDADRQIDPLSGASVSAFYVGERRWDVEFVTAQQVDDLVERLLGDPASIGLSHGDQDLAYRCMIGLPVRNAPWLAEVTDALRESNLFDVVVEKHHGLADGMLDDALGLLAVGDIPSAAFCARLAYEHMVDAWLARTGRICPSSKWRDRQLDTKPAGPIGVAEYRAAVCMQGYDGSASWVLDLIDRTRELGLDL